MRRRLPPRLSLFFILQLSLSFPSSSARPATTASLSFFNPWDCTDVSAGEQPDRTHVHHHIEQLKLLPRLRIDDKSAAARALSLCKLGLGTVELL